MSLWSSSSGDRCDGAAWLVGRAVAQHGVQDVAAAAREADQGGVVLLALAAFAVVVRPRGRVVQCGERGEEHRSFEVFVAASGGVLTADRGAGSAGDGCEAGVRGEVAGGGEARAVADFEQDPCAGPDADAGHRGQDRGKRVGIEHVLQLGSQLVPVVQQMNPRKMSEVLAAMSPERAERLVEHLARRRRAGPGAQLRGGP